MRLIEQLRGRGKIFKGKELAAEADYAIDVYQEMPSGIPGLKTLRGSIDLPAPKIFELFNETNSLTLELDDQRRVGFFFKNTATGEIANRTGIYDPNKEAQ